MARFRIKDNVKEWFLPTVILILLVIVIRLQYLLNRERGTLPYDLGNIIAHDKPRVLLVVGVLSQLKAIDRRNAIRATWFNVCRKKTDKVACRFFTDPVAGSNSTPILEEHRSQSDIEYMPIKSGMNFALRLIWMMTYFTSNYHFDFFLRIDDDYFLCLDRLLFELPLRSTNSLYWGYIHCEAMIVRVDEGFMILSRDIVVEALGKLNTTLLCHPFGDQAVALWIKDSKLKITYFSDNSRVIHEVTSYQGAKYLIPNICENYLGLHGAYPVYMRHFWKLTKDYEQFLHYDVPVIKDFRKVCPYSKEFRYEFFYQPYREIPVLCKYNPTFGRSEEPYKGREVKPGQHIQQIPGSKGQVVNQINHGQISNGVLKGRG